jgi:radical SAM protein with 4Fe4S-binding SPASM domain
MQSLPYSRFSQGLLEKFGRKRVPLCGSIEVTRRCPMNCVHCYNNLPLNDDTCSDELTYEEHCSIIDQITEAGCFWLLFTGGEIFTRSDFLDIYTYAKRKGLLITLFTNGTLITPEAADHLAEWRPFAIEITLYGRTKETHERVTKVPGSYAQCMQGIRLLMERRLPLKLKTVVIEPNKHELWDIKRFVEDDLRVKFKFDAMINPRIDPSPTPLAVRLTPEEVIALDLGDSKRMMEWGNFCSQFNGQSPAPGHYGELYQCGGGFNSFAIDPYGAMSICVLSHKDAYDLRTGSFQKGWEHFLGTVRQKRIRKQTKCLSCEIKAMCGMCPANGELENQDPEEPIDFMCQVAHLRAKALGLSIKPHGECEYCTGLRTES